MNCHLGGERHGPYALPKSAHDVQQCPSCAAELTEASVWMIAASETDCMGWLNQLTHSVTHCMINAKFSTLRFTKKLKPSQHWQPISILQRLCGRLTRLLFSHMRLLLGELAFQVAASKRRGINCHTDTAGKSSESVQCAITGPCLRMRHRPSAYRTVPIRKICRHGVPSLDSTR